MARLIIIFSAQQKEGKRAKHRDLTKDSIMTQQGQRQEHHQQQELQEPEKAIDLEDPPNAKVRSLQDAVKTNVASFLSDASKAVGDTMAAQTSRIGSKIGNKIGRIFS